jgi:AhpD family alkylhydroperoxidase
MEGSLSEFEQERGRLLELVQRHGTQTTKRFFNLDGAAYRDGALDRKQEELLGLVASAVLRCDDCINYHLVTCAELGWSRPEVVEALDVAFVGGSITIPHVRRAYDRFEELGLGDS